MCVNRTNCTPPWFIHPDFCFTLNLMISLLAALWNTLGRTDYFKVRLKWEQHILMEIYVCLTKLHTSLGTKWKTSVSDGQLRDCLQIEPQLSTYTQTMQYLTAALLTPLNAQLCFSHKKNKSRKSQCLSSGDKQSHFLGSAKSGHQPSRHSAQSVLYPCIGVCFSWIYSHGDWLLGTSGFPHTFLLELKHLLTGDNMLCGK